MTRAAGRDTVLVALRAGAGATALPPGSRPRLLSRPLNAYIVRAPAGVGGRTFAAGLERRPDVLAAQPNHQLREAASGCSPTFPSATGYYLDAVRADRVTPPPSAPPIAVLDTGLDVNLPEFADRVRSPVNLVSGGEDVSDFDGHGTEVAGVAAAGSPDVRGVSPTSPIVPVKILGALGQGDTGMLVQGIDAALARGARVINVSATAPADTTSARDDRVIQLAIGRAFTAGAIVVAAVGNEGTSALNVPSAYPHVLSVGATDQVDAHAGFSNTGPSVDLAAPGDMIETVAPTIICGSAKRFFAATGTSFAAPIVSGAAALLQQLRPSLSPSQVFEQLRRRARQTIPGAAFSPLTGFGLLDVEAAVNQPAPQGDGAEVDDDVYWVTGAFRHAHPPVLDSGHRSRTLRARVSQFNDPADVIPVKLRRGERFDARLAPATGSRPALSLWDPRTGAFDIEDAKLRRLVKLATGRAPHLVVARIARTGTFFVAVTAPKPDGPDTTYRLTLSHRRPR